MTLAFILGAITLAPLTVMLVVQLVLPILAGLLAKADASKPVIAVLLLAFSAGVEALNVALIADGTAVFSDELLLMTGVGWLISVASHFGVYDRSSLPAKLRPEFGIGRPAVDHDGD